MGEEYNIRYVPADRRAWDAFVGRLANPVGHGWPAFTLEASERGIYFLDHGPSPVSSHAFRLIIDEALEHGDSVVITRAE